MNKKCYFHLPGLFEFYELYKLFIPLFFEHRDYFYDFCEIGSIYGAPSDCLWGGGRVGYGEDNVDDVLMLTEEYNISSRLTFSNSLLNPEHLSDKRCNNLCRKFNEGSVRNGVIVHSDLLLEYIKTHYPGLYLVSSTTKVITDYKLLNLELNRSDFSYVVIDFRLNKHFDFLSSLPNHIKGKVEFLCNECCDFNCHERKECYEYVSHLSLGDNVTEHVCHGINSSHGYSFSEAMKNEGFISINDITDKYIPLGFTNFKIEGRSLGSALILEFLLYYLTKPEYHINVREAIYLNNSLDLF